MSSKNGKVDITSLTPQEARLYRLYGRIPSPSNHFAKHLKERKYFDSGDYALSKAGRADSAVGSLHPVPQNIPHPHPHLTIPVRSGSFSGSLDGMSTSISPGGGMSISPGEGPGNGGMGKGMGNGGMKGMGMGMGKEDGGSGRGGNQWAR